MVLLLDNCARVLVLQAVVDIFKSVERTTSL